MLVSGHASYPANRKRQGGTGKVINPVRWRARQSRRRRCTGSASPGSLCGVERAHSQAAGGGARDEHQPQVILRPPPGHPATRQQSQRAAGSCQRARPQRGRPWRLRAMHGAGPRLHPVKQHQQLLHSKLDNRTEVKRATQPLLQEAPRKRTWVPYGRRSAVRSSCGSQAQPPLQVAWPSPTLYLECVYHSSRATCVALASATPLPGANATSAAGGVEATIGSPSGRGGKYRGS